MADQERINGFKWTAFVTIYRSVMTHFKRAKVNNIVIIIKIFYSFYEWFCQFIKVFRIKEFVLTKQSSKKGIIAKWNQIQNLLAIAFIRL